MTVVTIAILTDGKLESVAMEYNELTPSIRISMQSGWKKEYYGQDIYECLGEIMKDLPDVNFLCKGAKLNVRPSSMSSQMTSGIMAYEHELGVRVTRKNFVNIFDYEDQDIINDPELQKNFVFRWLKSLPPR
jgi:hypothetical protein